VSAHVGDQFRPDEKDKMQKVFELFYWLINFGAFFSTLITPWTLDAYGPKVAFGVPGVLMFIATVVFWLGRKYYVHVPPSGSNPNSLLKIIWSGFRGKGASFWQRASSRHTSEHVDGVKAFFGVMLLFIWISVFWSLYDQSGSTWILQAQKMDLHFWGIDWKESQIQALNPIMILAIIPLFSLVVFPGLEKRGIRVTPVRKMITGMFLAAFGFATVAWIQMRIEDGEKLSVGWQFWPYLITAISEAFISITGLEFSYTQTPRTMKSTVMSFWLLTVAVGNLFTAYISRIQLYPEASSGYFWFFTALMAVTAIIFAIFASRYKMRSFMESIPVGI
jgi:POT family proton-dependent oligopeptide transporter